MRVHQRAQQLASWLSEWLSPACCAGCGEPASQPFCSDCARRLEGSKCDSASVEGCRVIAAGPYAPPLSEAIRAFKYRDRPDLAHPLAGLMLEQLRRVELVPPELLVPVPLHPRRLAERGYNQAALLARRVGRGLGVRTIPTALGRVRCTPQLAGQSRDLRIAQVQDAFVVRQASLLRGRNAMLVDDVLTTGATAAACVQVLRAAGARVHAIVAVARAGRDSSLS